MMKVFKVSDKGIRTTSGVFIINPKHIYAFHCIGVFIYNFVKVQLEPYIHHNYPFSI